MCDYRNVCVVVSLFVGFRLLKNIFFNNCKKLLTDYLYHSKEQEDSSYTHFKVKFASGRASRDGPCVRM